MARANAFAQYMLELINQFRLDPRGEYDRIAGKSADPYTVAALDYFDVNLSRLERELDRLDPVQPLAWNPDLADAARGHSKLLKASDSQSHQVTSLGEAPLTARVRAEGYESYYLGENVFSYSQSVRHAQDAFIADWGYGGSHGMQAGRGHRANLIEAHFSEVGIGMVRDTSSATEVGKYVVTQDFGARAGSGPFLLGVAYRDRDDDGFYSMGEGLGGLKVEVAGVGRTTGADAGGYAIEVEAGEARVKLWGGPVKGRIVADVDFGDGNVKLDVVDKRHLLTSADLELKSGAKSVTAIGAGDVDLTGSGRGDRLYGNDGRNTLDGGSGNDRLDGGDGHDRLLGGNGKDLLVGGNGRDRLVGGEGADRLVGGKGNDVLLGGDGADVFIFGARDGRDRIRDWDGEDTIRLKGASRSKVDIGRDDGDAIIEYARTTIVVKDAAGDIGWGDIDFA